MFQNILNPTFADLEIGEKFKWVHYEHDDRIRKKISKDKYEIDTLPDVKLHLPEHELKLRVTRL